MFPLYIYTVFFSFVVIDWKNYWNDRDIKREKEIEICRLRRVQLSKEEASQIMKKKEELQRLEQMKSQQSSETKEGRNGQERNGEERLRKVHKENETEKQPDQEEKGEYTLICYEERGQCCLYAL